MIPQSSRWARTARAETPAPETSTKRRLVSTVSKTLRFSHRLHENLSGFFDLSATHIQVRHHTEEGIAPDADVDPTVFQVGAHSASRDAGPGDIDKEEVGLDGLEDKAYTLTPRDDCPEPARVFVILREPVHVMLQGVKAGGGQHPRLPQGSTDALFTAPCFVDEALGACQYGAHRTA